MRVLTFNSGLPQSKLSFAGSAPAKGGKGECGMLAGFAVCSVCDIHDVCIRYSLVFVLLEVL